MDRSVSVTVAAQTVVRLARNLPRIADHFAHPEIKVFASEEKKKAPDWLQSHGNPQ
jgi:hypothetical protein